MSPQKLIDKPTAITPAGSKLPAGNSPGSASWHRPVAFFIALLLFAVANVGLATASKCYRPRIEEAILAPGAETNGHGKTWSWWLARRYLQQKRAPDVVLFGSSQMGSAMCAADAQHLYQVIDALTHRRAATLEDELLARTSKQVTVFSLASPGAMCSDALMASHALFRPKLSPRLVIISVSPRDFIDNTMPYPAATEPYRFYSQYADAGSLTGDAYIDPMSWLQFAIDSLPFKKLGAYLQASVAYAGNGPEKPLNEASPEELSGSGDSPMVAILGGAAVPGKWNVPANIPKTLWSDNTREYKNRFRNPNVPVYAKERKFFEKFLQDMQTRGIKVLVVGMPSLPMNRTLLSDSFWKNFRGMLSSQSSKYGASFLDLTDDPRFVKADYLDTVHLNAWGGQKLFARIAEYAASQDSSISRLLTTGPTAGKRQ
jgi:hypothetical protein